MEDAARAILAQNDRGGYTVPTADLYPFQWNWDSAFVAMGFASYDLDRACTELERLIEGQWDDGMIPHIIFHQSSDTYFPGPDVWMTEARHPKQPRTSGITQPPVFGMALAYIHKRAMLLGQDQYTERIRKLFDAAVRFHRWWLSARDPDRSGLVSILHPWESGSDNSPAWDEALTRVPTTTQTEIRRQDTKHINATMRPSDEDYQRFIHLVELYRDCQWDPKKQWARAPFKVADIQTTAILARSTWDLMSLATHLKQDELFDELNQMHQRLSQGLMGRWRDEYRAFLSLDLISGKDIVKVTQACFIPLLALSVTLEQRKQIATEIERWCDGLVVGVPSTPIFSPDFNSKRYWRGPVWAVINWLIIEGLIHNQLFELASKIKRDTGATIERTGFWEYFDPTTGEGLGGKSFSWTAAVYLLLKG